MHGFYGYGGYGASLGFPWGMLVSWGLVLAAIVVIGVLVIRALRARPAARDAGLDRLVERFAAGEISKEQFIEIRDLIQAKK